jgi:hypothetical protein
MTSDLGFAIAELERILDGAPEAIRKDGEEIILSIREDRVPRTECLARVFLSPTSRATNGYCREKTSSLQGS